MVLGAVLLWLCKVWNLAHFDSIFSNCCRNVLNSDERRLSSQLDHRKATNVMNHANDVIATKPVAPAGAHTNTESPCVPLTPAL